ncbi:nitroreductase family protein [Paenibacillus mesotrionivorans]|uniref:Nitroreductase family protein n=1 Tax=Paenibacillus mesotrionivorans TaxID=3160968 RepID=A0ACC7NUJ8_9BACL
MSQVERIRSREYLTAVKARRTIYAIQNHSPLSQEEIEEIVGEALLHTPSAFNSQSARIVLLFGQEHLQLWDLTKEALRPVVPEDQFSKTEDKLKSFANGYGTVLFFEDQSVIEAMQAQYELYKNQFPVWSEQSNGMLQHVIWTALRLEGLGASLQHYNPLIDDEVRRTWNIPAEWSLKAQMPFGAIGKDATTKEFKPLDLRLKVFR